MGFILKKQAIILSPNVFLNSFTPTPNPSPPPLAPNNNKNNNNNNVKEERQTKDNQFEKNGDLKRNPEHKRGLYKRQQRRWWEGIKGRGEGGGEKRERGGREKGKGGERKGKGGGGGREEKFLKLG